MLYAGEQEERLEPFTFLDVVEKRPYKVMRLDGAWWIFRWHDHQRSWVSFRKVTEEEQRWLRPLAIPKDQTKMYDDLHSKFERRKVVAGG